MISWVNANPVTAGAATLALVLVVIPWLYRSARGAL